MLHFLIKRKPILLITHTKSHRVSHLVTCPESLSRACKGLFAPLACLLAFSMDSMRLRTECWALLLLLLPGRKSPNRESDFRAVWPRGPSAPSAAAGESDSKEAPLGDSSLPCCCCCIRAKSESTGAKTVLGTLLLCVVFGKAKNIFETGIQALP